MLQPIGMIVVPLFVVGAAYGADSTELPKTRLTATDPATWKPVADRAVAPIGGVRLDEAGLFKPAMDRNVSYLLNSFSVNHMLVPFRQCAGQKAALHDPPQVHIWITGKPRLHAGRFMMGAGNTLRWFEHRELRERLDGNRST